MKKLKALIEKRNANLEAMGKMLDLCEAENRAFTDEEKKTYDTMMAETRSLADTIHAAEQVEGMSMEHEIGQAGQRGPQPGSRHQDRAGRAPRL